MSLPFPQKVQFVVGKGGVGKTTFAVALSLVAARAGKRVLLIEIEPGGRAAAFLQSPESPGYEARRTPSGVSLLAMDGRASLEEYLQLIIPVRRVLKAVFQTKVYQYFVAAAPGLKELMAIGKVWYEADRVDPGGRPHWDLIVVDAPATGHSLQYLRMPRAARETFGPGLVRTEASRIEALLEDASATVVHFVTTAEEMPATETIEAYGHLTRELRLPPGGLIANRVHHGAVSEAAVRRLRAGAETLGVHERDVALAVADRAAEENAWTALNREQLDRLRKAIPLPTMVLPEVFSEEFGADDVGRLSELLEAGWAARGGSEEKRSAGERT